MNPPNSLFAGGWSRELSWVFVSQNEETQILEDQGNPFGTFPKANRAFPNNRCNRIQFCDAKKVQRTGVASKSGLRRLRPEKTPGSGRVGFSHPKKFGSSKRRTENRPFLQVPLF